MAEHEIRIGSLVLRAEITEGRPHTLIIVRGKGQDGQRPLCGQFTVTTEEWQDLQDHVDQCTVEGEALTEIAHALHDYEKEGAPIQAVVSRIDEQLKRTSR